MFKMKTTSLLVRRALSAPAFVLLVVTAGPVRAELPVQAANWNQLNPNVRLTQTADYMRIDQADAATRNWVLNWNSFNISQGSRVQFVQPGANHIALNRIGGSNRSEIFGQLDANGRVYLINPNGFLFGSSSTINVNSLVASSLALNIADDDFINNRVNLLNLADNGVAAFINGALAAGITLEEGSAITTAEGGQVLIIAPEIINGGDISTRSGQVILAAAKDSVYLTPSNDSELRGFLVELGGTGGDIHHAGSILAERGNITLAGLSINQDGLLQATTSVYENGSIRLLARDQAMLTDVADNRNELVLGVDYAPRAQYHAATNTTNNSGEDGVVLGANSRIVITPDSTDDTRVVDAQDVNLSRVEITGHDITLKSGAQIVAAGAEVLLHAAANPSETAVNNDVTPLLRPVSDNLVVLEQGAVIDVSGTTDTRIAMARNQLDVQLTGDFLKDAPLQRDGVLRNEHVQVDIREGTSLGDISDAVAAGIERTIGERLSEGGRVDLLSQGGVVMQQGSEVNIAGGAVNYDAGYVTTSRLITAQGRVVDIADASPDVMYTGLFGTLSIKSDRWGSAGARRWSMSGDTAGGVSRYYDAYVEGQDAGSFNIHARAVAGMANVIAGAQVSPLQRDTAPTEHQVDSSGNLLGDYPGERAWGGALQIQTGSLHIDVVENAVEPVLEDMQDWLQSGGQTVPTAFSLQLDEDVFNSGLSKVVVSQDRASVTEDFGGSFEIRSDAMLHMASNAELIVDSGVINVQGSIDIDSGTVHLNSSGLATVNNSIDVSGGWVNDNPALGGNPATAVDIDGGSIAINAVNMDLSGNSALLANGGGQVQANGKIRAGEGGDITLAVQHPNGGNSELTMDGAMEAYGINEARGGSLSITANRMRIAPEATDIEPGLLQFTPEFFTRNGFADYSLTANKGELRVAADTHIAPVANNLVLNTDANFRRSGADVRDFSQDLRLPDYLRAATNISLASNQKAMIGGLPTATSSLTIERGARIVSDPGASVNLSSASRLFMQGDIAARGGDINLKLSGYGSQQDRVMDDQVLWLDGKLDVSGIFIADPVNDSGLRGGTLLDGGNITLSATDGFVVTTTNSDMNVSGVSAGVDLPAQTSGNVVTAYSRQTLQGDAGAVRVSAAEGMILSGDMQAQGSSDSAHNGSLTVVMDALRTGSSSESSAYASSRMARQVNLVQNLDDLPVVPDVGASMDVSGADSLLGQAWVAADSITQAGFYRVELQANRLENKDNTLVNGVINLRDDVNLSVRQSLQLSAPVIRANGNVNLNAAYVTLGSFDPNDTLTGTVSATGGSGRMNIHAQGLLDVAGDVRLQGMDEVTLVSDGDLRLRGLKQDNADEFELNGSLHAAADMLLRADQVYATTLSDVAVNAGHIVIEGGDAPAPVLSAGSRLSFTASDIDHNGVVKAPLGEVLFNADNLRMGDGSLTSVSAENQIIPFGQILGERAWTYGKEGLNDESDNYINALPEKRISLNADNIDMNPGAEFDISGGGDFYAFEFVPGLGGSIDHLLQNNSNGAFAVLPAYSGYAAYDHVAWQGVDNINMGDQVYLNGSALLPAGTYTVLPARYALLPGAWLITPTGDNMLSSQQFRQLDGSAIVAGQMRVANTPVSDAQWSGFVVENGAEVRARSEYFERTASQFFRDAAVRNNVALGSMAEDAGSLDIIAGASLNLAGVLRGDAAAVDYLDEDGVGQTATGRGSQLNIAGNELHVVNADDTGAGGIRLLDTDLNDFGAASVLLGGSRSRDTDGTSINVTANNVTVEQDASLAVPDLILAARSSVTVAGGADIHATGDAGEQDEVLNVSGDGALLRVSNADQARIVRTGESASPTRANILIAAAANVSADRSMILDASLNSTVAGMLSMENGSLNLGASRISLGNVTGTPAGLVLDENDLASLNVNELVLSSRSGVDIYGNFEREFSSLVIDAAALNGYQAADEQVRFQADSITLGNTGNAVATGSPTGLGQLNIEAGKIQLDKGQIALRGFSDIRLQAASISLEGSGGLNAGNSDLTLDGRITANTRRAQYHIGTDGNIITANTTQTTEPRSEALAAELSMQAAQIEHGGEIDLASGDVSLLANNGNVLLDADSIINVSGISRDFAGDVRYSQGGHVELDSTQGSVTQDQSAVINVSGGGNVNVVGGKAGSVKVSAANGSVDLNGVLLAQHGANETGGGFELDVQSMDVADFSELNTRLNANGFNQKRHLRFRNGDFTLEAADPDNTNTLRARDVLVATDNGSIHIRGIIDASNTDGDGGDITLAARDNVTVYDTALLDASTHTPESRGGKVFIETREGSLDLRDDAVINVSGTERGGRIHLRAPRTVSNNGVNIAPVSISVFSGFERLDVEGFKTYNLSDISNTVTIQDINNPDSDLMTETRTFMDVTDLSGILSGDAAQLVNAHLRPGIEFEVNGDLVFNEPVLLSRLGLDPDTYEYRIERTLYSNNNHQEAGILTLRATDNIDFNATLSDGFAEDLIYPFQALQTGESWFYRIVAGADTEAAHVMTTTDNGSDLTLADDVLIRTGKGDIDIAAAGDLVMETGSSIYSAGENTGRGTLGDMETGDFTPDWAGYGSPYELLLFPEAQFPENGGDVRVEVAGNIEANLESYLASDWLHRANIGGMITTWGVVFSEVKQGIGAFGGGDLTVRVGGDANRLALFSPVTGRADGQVVAEDNGAGGLRFLDGTTNEVNKIGGGNVSLQVEGDITRTFLHADDGLISVDAGGNIGSSVSDSGIFVLLADSMAHIHARGDIYSQGVSNANIQPLSQRQKDLTSGFYQLSEPADMAFSTYSQASAWNLISTAGDITLVDQLNGIQSGLIYPASVSLLAMDGGITMLSSNVLLTPSAFGQMSLLAQNDINAQYNTLFRMLTISPDRIPDDPVSPADLTKLLLTPDPDDIDTLLHQNDTVPVRIVTRTGTIAPQDLANSLDLDIPKPVFMYAGEDILAVNVVATHYNATDVSSIHAGRDIRHINTEVYGDGAEKNAITIHGPGELHVLAGRDIDLGDGNGIQARGDFNYPILPDAAADILIMAGADAADYGNFINQYFVADSEYATSLIAFMNARGENFAATEFDAARLAYNNLDETQQRSLVMQAYFNEISQSAQRAAREQNNLLPEDDLDRFGYTRGLNAVAALFPSTVTGQRPAEIGEVTHDNIIVTGGQVYEMNPHAVNGDVTMVASNITAQDDGADVHVLAPGGLLNVGLSVKNDNESESLPNGVLAFGDGDINIYAMGNIAVNQSRIQALNGGDMSIWSSLGNIDAGRGAKTAVSPPPLAFNIDVEQNRFVLSFAPTVRGSGIANSCFTLGCEAGDITLAAPAGVIDAGDAGIRSQGNILLATDTVLNAGNIDAGGESVGFSTDSAAMGLDLGNLSSAAGDSTAMMSGEDAADAFANAAVAILQVEVMGLSDEEGSVSENRK